VAGTQRGAEKSFKKGSVIIGSKNLVYEKGPGNSVLRQWEPVFLLKRKNGTMLYPGAGDKISRSWVKQTGDDYEYFGGVKTGKRKKQKRNLLGKKMSGGCVGPEQPNPREVRGKGGGGGGGAL